MTSATILKFALKHWKEILMAVLLITVVGKFRYDYKQLERAYEITQNSLEQQLAGLQAIHQRELERRQEVLESYREAIIELEQNYLEAQIELEKQKRESRRQHVEDFSGDQEQLVRDIQEVYGFTHAP